jgi:hypothetical protein
VGQIADEIDDARVWGGIHFRFSQTLGRTLGDDVGQFAAQKFLHPLARKNCPEGWRAGAWTVPLF